MGSKARTALLGPQPAESAGGQRAINEAVERFLEDYAPRLAFPDTVDQRPQAVSKERGHASNVKHHGKPTVARNRSSRYISHEQTHEEAISEPHAEELRQSGRSAGINGEKP